MDVILHSKENIWKDLWLSDKETDIVIVDGICNEKCWLIDCHGVCFCCGIALNHLYEMTKEDINNILNK